MRRITAYLEDREFELISQAVPDGKSLSSWAKEVMMERANSLNIASRRARDYEFELTDGSTFIEEGATAAEAYMRKMINDKDFSLLNQWRMVGDAFWSQGLNVWSHGLTVTGNSLGV